MRTGGTRRITGVLWLALLGLAALTTACQGETRAVEVTRVIEETVVETDQKLVPTVTPVGSWPTPNPTHTPGPPPTATPAPYEPTLYISYREGAPGSVFTLTGLNFPGGEPVMIWINGQSVAMLEPVSDYSNWFGFHLDTMYADQGLYFVIAHTPSVVTGEFFELRSDEPVRQPLEWPGGGHGETFVVPQGIAFTHQVFLSLVMK